MYRRTLLAAMMSLMVLGTTMCTGSSGEPVNPYDVVLDLIPTSGPAVISVDGAPVNVAQPNCPPPGEVITCPICPTAPPLPIPAEQPEPGLGVTAAEMRMLYEEMGFTFQDSISDGIESVSVNEYGRAADGYDVVEFSGHPDNLALLSLNGTLIEGDDINNTATALHLLSTFNRLTPTWIASDDWLAESLWQATLTESDPYTVEITHGVIYYSVEISESLGSIIITARRAQ